LPVSDEAYQAALKMLGRRDYFRSELVERLGRKGFSDADIDGALARCDEIGLMDDDRLATRFVEFRAVSKGWGPRRLEAELRRRGVEKDLASAAARLVPEDLRRALDTAIRRAEVRARDGWWRLSERRARMVSSLIARGFEASDAIAAVDELAAAREKQHHALDDQ
jgi:regulatory protein